MNSSSAVASLAEAIAISCKCKKAGLLSVLVVVKFNCYHKIILKLNTENEFHILFPLLPYCLLNCYYTVLLA